LAPLPTALGAQSRDFHGVYLGAEVGREDFIGGSFVDGVDFLAQDTKRVASLVAGVRYQTAVGIVVGAEGTWGSTDGDLTLEDPANDLRIDYANDTQTSIGGMLGFAAGSVLLFAHASEVTRHFDVRVTRGGGAFDQKDEQGMLRYGIGVEATVVPSLQLRLEGGFGRADFGDARTNIEPERPLQLALGVMYQF
jgi:hypothetical protein